MSTTTTEKKPKSNTGDKKPKKEATVPTVLYPEVTTNLDDRVIDEAKARSLLGWEEETDDVLFGENYLFTDTMTGKKVRCRHNVTNRPLYASNYEALKQDILNRRFVFNGEPIILGKTGKILNGQHTLIAVVMAERERLADLNEDDPHWTEKWEGPVAIEKLIVCGIDEDDAVVNTMDTCKPRSLADVIYRSEYLSKLKADKRKTAARYLDHAVRLLWQRLGLRMDPFAPMRTHAEALDFLERHKKVIKAVSFFMQEGRAEKVGLYVSPGYASALLYLMAASNTDAARYHDHDSPSEKRLDLSRWDQAEAFWDRLLDTDSDEAKKDKGFIALRKALGDASSEGFGGFVPASGVLATAWEALLAEQKIEKTDLSVPFVIRSSDGAKVLGRVSTFCPIDLGSQRIEVNDDAPTPEELEQAKKVLKGKSLGRVSETRGPLPSPETTLTEEQKEAERKAKIEETKRKREERRKAAKEAGRQESTD